MVGGFDTRHLSRDYKTDFSVVFLLSSLVIG